MKKHIPNFITSLNVVSGFAALLFVMQGNLTLASLMIFAAMFFDYIDGFAARMLNAKSEVGKELDSLGDVISFGVAPGLIVAVLISRSVGIAYFGSIVSAGMGVKVSVFMAVLIPVFAALRLARFNVYQSHSSDFTGLPVPSSAMYYVSLPLILAYDPNGVFSTYLLNNTWFYVGSILLFSYLNVSDIKMFSFKLKTEEKNTSSIYQLILLFFGLVMIFSFRVQAIPMVIISYVLLSIVKQSLDK